MVCCARVEASHHANAAVAVLLEVGQGKAEGYPGIRVHAQQLTGLEVRLIPHLWAGLQVVALHA